MKEPPLTDLTIVDKAMARAEKQARRITLIGTACAAAAGAVMLALTANGVVVVLVVMQAGALGGWIASRIMGAGDKAASRSRRR